MHCVLPLLLGRLRQTFACPTLPYATLPYSSITLDWRAGCVSIPEAEELAAAIDGTDGRSWHLPLPPLTRTSLEPHAPGALPCMSHKHARAYFLGHQCGALWCATWVHFNNRAVQAAQ